MGIKGINGPSITAHEIKIIKLHSFHGSECAINDLKSHTNLAVYMKQVGSHLKKTMGLSAKHGDKQFEWPKNLRIREFPL